MATPRILRNVTSKRFDPSRIRIDAVRQLEFGRSRSAIAAELLGRKTPFDLKPTWLTLRPDAPFVADKGHLEYTSPSFIGTGNFEDGQYMYAAFDLIFEKEEAGSYSIERPNLTIRLPDPPSPVMLVEMDLHAYDWPAGNPKFELITNNSQTITFTEGVRETIMFLMHGYASIQSAWAEGADFKDKDGNWAFFEARISPINQL